MIREVDPPTLSSRLTGMGETARQVAAQRQAKVKVLESQLRGDLEWITIRALEKEPARRYQSASDLAEEVSRNLADEPVLAGPPSTSYRITKFVKKNRVAVGFLAAFIGLLIIALAATTFLFLRSEAAREIAEIEAQRIKLEALAMDAALVEDYDAYLSRSAESLELHRRVTGEGSKVATYLVRRLWILHLFSLGSSDERLESLIRDEAKTSLTIVNDALLKGDQGMVEIAAILGALFEEEDDQETAEQLYRRVLTLLRHEPSRDSILTKTEKRLARILERRGTEAMRSRRPADAEQLYREALTLRLDSEPERNSVIAFAELELGRSLVALGQYEEAETYLQGSYDYFVADRGQDSAEVQMVLRAITELYKAAGKEKEASYYQRLQPKPIIAAATDLGPLPFESVIRSRAGGFSTRFRDRLVCVFGQTQLNASKKYRSSTWAWTNDFDAADGLKGFHETLDEFEVPSQLVPFTESELSFNRENEAQWQLYAGPIVLSPDGTKVLLFYSKELGRFDTRKAGTSLAIWDNPGEGLPIRPRLREGIKDPTILFPRPEPALGAAALVDRGYLYAYATECKQLSCLCTVARVPFDQALDRKAWRFYDGAGWSKDWKDAKVIMDAAPVISVHWNNHLSKYLAIYSKFLDESIAMMTADRPEGPWSDSRQIFEGLPPVGEPNWGNWGGMAHEALSKKNGQVEYVTYQRNTGFFEGETRLVEIVFQ
jgi:tetratricopeptide (TPR) repeat protein